MKRKNKNDKYPYTRIKYTEKGLPYDAHGHVLDPADIIGREARQLTSPFVRREFAVGTRDDFWCFDFAILPNGRVALHAVINADSEGFFDDGAYLVVPKEEAADQARRLVSMALEWCAEHGLSHSYRDCGKDPMCFARAVNRAVSTPHLRLVAGSKGIEP